VSRLATLRPVGGDPLAADVRQRMEGFFGTSFADVRIHISHDAAAIGASAFTHGTHIYFAPGQYNLQSAQGRQVLGRELAHVIQQKAGRVHNPFGRGVAVVHNATLEVEAERMGNQAAAAPVTASRAVTPFRPPVQRSAAPVTRAAEKTAQFGSMVMNTAATVTGLQAAFVPASVENMAAAGDANYSNIRYGAIKAGQRSAATATLAPNQAAGSVATYSFPFFSSSFGGHRGHLIARTYGGSGSDARNLVPLGDTANVQMYKIFEGEIKTHLTAAAQNKLACNVTVVVTPYYGSDPATSVQSVIPEFVQVQAKCTQCDKVLLSAADGKVVNTQLKA
jgi:hypothetical protein